MSELVTETWAQTTLDNHDMGHAELEGSFLETMTEQSNIK